MNMYDERSINSSTMSKSSFEMANAILSRSRRKSSLPSNQNLPTNQSLPVTQTISLYDGGTGGLGIDYLNFENIQQKQWEMFRRTIELQAPRQLENLLQEKRQTTLVTPLRRIRFMVCREDFPSVKAHIELEYDIHASQMAWEPLLSQIYKKLKVEFIHSIIERGDKAPIFRILLFKDGGDYLVRQRESSAILEVLNTSIPPIETSWEITKDIVSTKEDLSFALKNVHKVNDRILHLVTQPMTIKSQQEITNQIKNTHRPDNLIQLVNSLYLANTSNAHLMDMKVESLQLNYNQLGLFHKRKLDIIAIHRQVLEKLNQLATMGQSELIVKECTVYLLNLLMDLLLEVDIVVMGLKLISDLVSYFLTYREKIFNVILDCLQYYSPVSPYHRPRQSLRLLEKQRQKQNVVSDVPSNDLSLPTNLSSYSHLQGLQSNSSTDMYSGLLGLGKEGNEYMIEQLELKATFLRLVKDTPTEKLESMTKIQRYPVDLYALEEEKSIYRKDTQSLSIFAYAKPIELDEELKVITPRTKKTRQEQQQQQVKKKPSSPIARAISPTARQTSLQDLTNSKLIQSRPSRTSGIVGGTGSTPTSGNNSRTASPKVSSGRKGSGTVSITSSPKTGHSKTVNTSSGEVAKVVLASRRLRSGDGSESNDDQVVDSDQIEGDRELRTSIITLPKVVEGDQDSLVSSIHSGEEAVKTQLKPSEIAEEKKKRSKKYRIKTINFEQEKIEEISSPIRWKGSLGEIGRRPAQAEAMDANRILTAGKSSRGLDLPPSISLPTIRTSSASQIGLGASKPSTPVSLGTIGKNKTMTKSIRFQDQSDLSQQTPNTFNNGPSDLATTASSASDLIPPSPTSVLSQTSRRDSQNPPPLLRRGTSKRLSRQRSSRLSHGSLSDTNSISGKKSIEGDPEAEEELEESEPISLSKDMNDPNASNTEDWLPNISSTIQRRQKPKFRLEPLPTTDYPKFRIFDFQMKENVVLIQGFATMLKLLMNSYGNRDYAFRNHVLTEIAELVLVCPAIPRILEYFVEMFHVMYAEGIGDPLDITWQDPEDPSMILSTVPGENESSQVLPEKGDDEKDREVTHMRDPEGNLGGDAGTVTTISSKYFDATSDMSLPSFDPDQQRSIISVSDNKFNPRRKKSSQPTEKSSVPVTSTTRKTVLDATQAADGNQEKTENREGGVGAAEEEDEKEEGEAEDGPKDIVIQHISMVASVRSVMAVAPRPKEAEPEESVKNTNTISAQDIAKMSKRQRIKYNEEILSQIGLSEYDLRYRKMPDDAIIMAIAMASNHIEVKENLKEEAAFWLDHFNDGSRDYMMLKRKGFNLANLS